ncbi:DUF2169 domain-containing protein [Corallococcus sp. H22C18031201]|uniref:DUF2169 family type VI secretion system accessory protein n=1 Tax=Citreicoccus inhibens TaxID=2849499 RepID=UPI000E76D1F8|nr:DUF2169 domain-containing protein [Citreicoccus inhibens]MBU8896804.1 DUF2169 domain-containing protein [Citreicoccus inhibens]RJS21903.1 DUF2169 domain-containing protein [Corallococcus sp. H22C18031201]
MGHPTVENETPFICEFMGCADEEGRPLLLLLIKATYLLSDGRLMLAAEQEPVKWAGEPWGKPGESSDKYEPECAFFKPATDVVLIGHGYTQRKGDTETLVALQVGPVKKALRVVGERTWFRSLGRVGMTQPLPFEKLPLTWERAFGGWDKSDADTKKHGFEPRNPVGVGFRASPRNFEEGLMLPNLEDPAQPLRELGQRVTPMGVGFTSPHWQPRAAFAGTYDKAWETARKPLLPTDFDRRFFNAGAPGLVAPGYLRGDEAVMLVNVTPQGRLGFSLPAQPTPVVTVEQTGAEDARPDVRLDTVILEPDAKRVVLMWRAHLALEDGFHSVRTMRITAQGVSRPPESRAGAA